MCRSSQLGGGGPIRVVLLPPRCAASQPRLGNLALAGRGLPVRGLPCPRRLPVCGAPLRCRALGGRRLGGPALRGHPLPLRAVTDLPPPVARRPLSRCPLAGLPRGAHGWAACQCEHSLSAGAHCDARRVGNVPVARPRLAALHVGVVAGGAWELPVKEPPPGFEPGTLRFEVRGLTH